MAVTARKPIRFLLSFLVVIAVVAVGVFVYFELVDFLLEATG